MSFRQKRDIFLRSLPGAEARYFPGVIQEVRKSKVKIKMDRKSVAKSLVGGDLASAQANGVRGESNQTKSAVAEDTETATLVLALAVTAAKATADFAAWL